MGRDAALASPAAREVFETADDALGLPLSRICFEGPAEELRRTEIQQPAILATSVALLRALEAQLEAQLEASLALEPVCVLGHSLGMSVVAEGVETEEQLVFLRNAQCELAQGFLFSRPLPAGQFARLLARKKPYAVEFDSRTRISGRG